MSRILCVWIVWRSYAYNQALIQIQSFITPTKLLTMSIPKEPRQLMINIMYLVLTAMLALNVSAEIFNAFKVLDQGIIQSNLALDSSNAPMQQAILEAAKAKPSFQTYADRVAPIRHDAKTLNDYIISIKDSLINESGGYKIDPDTQQPTSHLAGEKRTDITTRILVNNSGQTDNKGIGEELKNKLLDYKTKILDYIDDSDKASFQNKIAINVDDDTWREAGKASWSHMNFDQMPLQAVIPIFNKYINDIKSTESAALNYLGERVGIGKKDLVLNDLTVIAAPEKSYVIKGEPFNADIFLTATAGADSGTKVELSVNGQPIRVNREGRGQYSINTSSTGSKSYTATAKVYNPLTDKTTRYTKEFTYEVGERSVAVSPTKMNVFYIGVDNPVEISAAGSNSHTLQVKMSGEGGGTIRKATNGTYVVNVTTPTRRDEYAEVKVIADGLNTSKKFRVKRIPDPVAKLSGKKSGAMSSGAFKLQKRLFAVLENFDFEAECQIEEFRLVRVAKYKDAIGSYNKGAIYNAETQSLVDKAKPSDKYYFEDIKCKCPGDSRTRDLGFTLFKII